MSGFGRRDGGVTKIKLADREKDDATAKSTRKECKTKRAIAVDKRAASRETELASLEAAHA